MVSGCILRTCFQVFAKNFTKTPLKVTHKNLPIVDRGLKFNFFLIFYSAFHLILGSVKKIILLRGNSRCNRLELGKLWQVKILLIKLTLKILSAAPLQWNVFVQWWGLKWNKKVLSPPQKRFSELICLSIIQLIN